MAELQAVTGHPLAVLVLVYVPATAMILRRPNVGRLPAWIERYAANLPHWLPRQAIHASRLAMDGLLAIENDW